MSEPIEADREQFFDDRGFGQGLELGERPALLVVDMMTAFTDASYDLGADLDAEIEAIGRLQAAAERADRPVIYVHSAYDDSDLDGGVLWIQKQGGADVLRTGSEAVTIDERLDPGEDATRLRKKAASAFFGTDLAAQLTARRVDTVVVTGCTTSGCVRATAVDAVQHGFVPVVPRQAVGDRDAEAHEASLFDLEMKYAEVLDVDSVLEYFEAAGSPEPT